jgi:hypothetical protein
MENGWIKVFEDGEIIAGPDSEEQTTWSRSRLDGLGRVDLFFHGARATIEADGEYWHSDDYVVMLNSSGAARPEKIYRRLQLKLDDKWLTVVIDPSGGFMVTLEDGKI